MARILVQGVLFKHGCPVCSSKDTYHRIRRGNYRCRQCGSVFIDVVDGSNPMPDDKEGELYVLDSEESLRVPDADKA